MGISSFWVLLDSPNRQYFPGGIITGQVVVTGTGEEYTTAITIRLFGDAETSWVESRWGTLKYGYDDVAENRHRCCGVRKGGNRRIQFYSHQSLLEMTALVFGDGQNKQRIPPEGLRIPFSIQLPNIPLPISCTLNEGVIQYALEGRIKQPWYTSDKTSTVPFTIFPLPLDLMSVPAARIPTQMTTEKTFGCCCCCKSGPLTVSASAPVMGWCMGDQVPVAVEIFNKSDRRVFDVTAQVVQVWTVSGTAQKLFSYENSINETVFLGTGCRRGAGVKPGDTEVWQFRIQVPLNIPPTPCLPCCDIIQMQYFIQLEVLADGNSLIVALPIIVGNTRLEPVLVSEHSTLYEGVGSG